MLLFFEKLQTLSSHLFSVPDTMRLVSIFVLIFMGSLVFGQTKRRASASATPQEGAGGGNGSSHVREVIDLLSSSDEEASDHGSEADSLEEELLLELRQEAEGEEGEIPSTPSRNNPARPEAQTVAEREEEEDLDLNFVNDNDQDAERDSPVVAPAAASEPEAEEITPPAPTATPCPTGCGGFLTMRRRKRDDSPFWACTNYASTGCRYTEVLVEPSQSSLRLVEGNRSAFTFHSKRKVKLKGGRTMHYKICSEKKRKKCPARVRVDVDTGECRFSRLNV